MTATLFVGGAHGVGKSFLASRLAYVMGGTHVSASSLIGRHSIDRTAVKVADPYKNQTTFLAAWAKIADANDLIVLDGHFCLLSSKTIVRVPEFVLDQVRPKAIILVEGTPGNVRERLGNDIAPTQALQAESLLNCEREEAFIAARRLDVPILTCTSGVDTCDVREFLVAVGIGRSEPS